MGKREIEKLERAIRRLAKYVDAIAWRTATDEEVKAGIRIRDEIEEILGW